MHCLAFAGVLHSAPSLCSNRDDKALCASAVAPLLHDAHSCPPSMFFEVLEVHAYITVIPAQSSDMAFTSTFQQDVQDVAMIGGQLSGSNAHVDMAMSMSGSQTAAGWQCSWCIVCSASVDDAVRTFSLICAQNCCQRKHVRSCGEGEPLGRC